MPGIVNWVCKKQNGGSQDLYEAFYKMEIMVDIMYVDYEEKMKKEEREKGREEDDAPSPYLAETNIVASFTSHGRGLGKVEVQRRLNKAIITCCKINI